MINLSILDSFQSQFNQLILDTQRVKDFAKSKINTTPLLTEWAKNKERFYKAFGNTVIYDTGKKIECEISRKEKQELIDNFLNDLEETINDEDIPDLKNQLENLHCFLSIISLDEFFNNMLEWNYPGYQEIKAGGKTIKAFKTFFSEEYSKELVFWQQKASELVQKSKITGYLKFSIHPLDFLTISENEHNWTSCHSLHGDYAGGNLDYLTDSVTFVAYLSSTPYYTEKIEHLNNFQWNSKKWRMLVYVNENNSLVFLGREYPFTNSYLNHATKQFITNVLLEEKDNWDTGWYDSFDKVSQTCNTHIYEEIRPSYFYQQCIIPVSSLVKRTNNPLHYNDLLFSSYYLPTVRFGKNYTEEDTITIGGGKTLCAFCGEHEVTDSELLFCNECAITYTNKLPEEYVFCDHCGAVILEDDSYWLADSDAIVCEKCYNVLK